MPIFSILFFILSLANCGVPLTLNFVGEFMSLYGVFERLPLLGVIASSSIIFSAAYTIYMFNRIAFGGYFSKFFEANISDVNKCKFFIIFKFIFFNVLLIYLYLINNYIKNKKKRDMPQLVPFYFINQVTFAFILLVIMIYVFSMYILPRFVRLFATRIFISKL